MRNKSIATIINKANRKVVDSLRKKEDQLYKKSPKRYHISLKTIAGLHPNGKDQPILGAIRDPTTNKIPTPELDNMHNPVPFSAAGNGLLGFGLLGNGGSDGCGDFV